MPRYLEIAFHVVVVPGPDDRAIVQAEIFDVASDDVVHRLSRGVLQVDLEVDNPAFGLERCFLNRNAPGPGFKMPVAKEAKMQNIKRVLAPINPPDEWSFEGRMLAPVEKNQNTVLN